MDNIKNEYFSNCYKGIISNKIFLLIVFFIEYLLTLLFQLINYLRQFSNENEEAIISRKYNIFYNRIINSLHNSIKLIIVIIIFALIIIYYIVFSKYSFKEKHILKIIINIFEIFIFRVFFIFICHLIFSTNEIILLFSILLSIPILTLNIMNFLTNHLYYFTPKIMIYPFDYFTSINDIFHIFEKLLICISLQSTLKSFNQLLYIIVLVLQLIILFFSFYILKFKSYIIMNNIFLNKARFSFNLSIILINFIIVILGKSLLKNSIFFLLCANIFVIFFIITQNFYNPYKYMIFDNDENIENIYYYFFIIDQKKNESFILEEKLENHYIRCGKCNLCKKLKKYLTNCSNYRKLYKILYKDANILSKIMNELIHTMLISGKESFKNNSYYIINIIYCYYIHLNKKNIVLSSNLRILYDIINEENKNILENHILSTQQLFLINEFLSKADNILTQMQEILVENIVSLKVKKFFSLIKNIFILKEKKFLNQLYYNKNEGIINFFKDISICTIIYEEIFNIRLNNNGTSLKENQLILEILSNRNNNELNQIIIQLDLLYFENRIIYIVGEFSKYKNKTLCQLFPNIFRSKQLSIIKNTVINSKFFKNNENTQKGNLFEIGNNNIDNNWIEYKCVIYDIVNNIKIFKLIIIRLNLIYPLEITRKILLSGFYSIENNIIITLDKSTKEKKREIVLNKDSKDDNDENKYNSSIDNNEYITFKRNDKYYNKKKLIFINQYFINPNCYNIYCVYHSEKQKTHISEASSPQNSAKKNIYNIESKKNIEIYGDYEPNQNLNFIMQSQSSTTFAQISSDKLNLKKRNKKDKINKRKKNDFRNCQFLLVIIAFIILFFQIIIHYITLKTNKSIECNNNILMNFKNFYALYNCVYTTIFSLICISKESKGKECISVTRLYEEYYINSSNNNNFNLTWFILEYNKFLSNEINKLKYTIFQILSDGIDEDIETLFNSPTPYLFLTQKILKNDIILKLNVENITFINLFEYMSTAFLTMSSNYENLNDIVYILDQSHISKDILFTHVKLNQELTQYQNYYYFLILNFQNFIQSLDIISLRLIIKGNNQSKTYILYAELYALANISFYLILHICIFIYIRKYYKILTDLFLNIQSKLNLKNDNISVRELFIKKIEKLKIIISLYKQDIYQAIVDLNFIYDNYKKFVEEKNKEIIKNLRKEKYLNDFNNSKPDKKKYDVIKLKYIKNAGDNKIYFYTNIITLIYSFIIILIIVFLWEKYYSTQTGIRKLIQFHGSLSDDGYKLINYYQLMIFYNISFEDINRFERYNISKGENVFSKIYSDIEGLYESNKLKGKLGQYNLANIDLYYDFNCSSYYELLFQNEEFLKDKNNSYKEFLIDTCENSKIFKSNNYKHMFSTLFQYYQKGMNQINDHSYTGLINNLYDNHFPKTVIYFITVFFYSFEILGAHLQRKSYQKLFFLLLYYSNIGIIIIYLSTIGFILIIIFFYIWNINLNYAKIIQLKKIFKVCNKKE